MLQNTSNISKLVFVWLAPLPSPSKVVVGVGSVVPLPQHLPRLPQDLLDKPRVRTALCSSTRLNFRCLGFFLGVRLHLSGGQVGQQDGGGPVQSVEPRQFIWEDFNYWEEDAGNSINQELWKFIQ